MTSVKLFCCVWKEVIRSLWVFIPHGQSNNNRNTTTQLWISSAVVLGREKIGGTLMIHMEHVISSIKVVGFVGNDCRALLLSTVVVSYRWNVENQSWLCWPANSRSEPRNAFRGGCRAPNARFQVSISLTSTFYQSSTSSWFWPSLFPSLDLIQMKWHLRLTPLFCANPDQSINPEACGHLRGEYDCLVKTHMKRIRR